MNINAIYCQYSNGDITMRETLEGIKGRKAEGQVKDNVNVVSEPIKIYLD